jgi:hypothetical protein
MKLLKTILKQEPVYLHNWKEKIDLIGDFENIYMRGEEYRLDKAPYANESYYSESKERMTKAIEQYKDTNILFASYGQDNYSGDAFVLFERDGKLFEVNGSHCSCYGLEGQFNPSEVDLKGLEHRLVAGQMGQDTYSDNEFAGELKQFLGIKS